MRMIVGVLMVLAALALSPLKAQTATLTPGQAVAIKAQEMRENDALGQVKYDSVTFEVVQVKPAVRLVTSPEPSPGTVAASVIERLTGGKQPPANQGYRDAIYWLVPQEGGDGRLVTYRGAA